MFTFFSMLCKSVGLPVTSCRTIEPSDIHFSLRQRCSRSWPLPFLCNPRTRYSLFHCLWSIERECIKQNLTEVDKRKNKYFSSIPNRQNLLKLYYLCNDSLNDISIEEQEVVDIMSTLLVNKHIGPDCISHRMLKSTVHTIY